MTRHHARTADELLRLVGRPDGAGLRITYAPSVPGELVRTLAALGTNVVLAGGRLYLNGRPATRIEQRALRRVQPDLVAGARPGA